MNNGLKLYEIINAKARPFSPFAWRSRMALLHLGLPFEACPVLFTEIPDIEDGSSRSVPVLNDSGTIVHDSWVIADYLQSSNYGRVPLFANADARRYAGFMSAWFGSSVIGLIFPLIVADIHASLDPRDQDYFRSSREKRLGKPLEQVCLDPEPGLAGLRQALEPMRRQLGNSDYLGGDQISYADFIPFAGFIWAEVSSDLELLTDDDPLQAWLARCYAWLDKKQA